MTERDLDPSAGGRLFFQSGILRTDQHKRAASRVVPREAALTEPAREIPVHAECDVLVVGGGPSTGGLVIWIDRMTDWEGRQVIRGFAEEFLDRLPIGAVAGPPQAAWGS